MYNYSMFGKKSEKIIEEKKVREVSTFREYFELFAETLVYVFFVMTFLLQSFVIPTGSMQNNILIGDHLLVNKVAYSRSQGSIDDIILPKKRSRADLSLPSKRPRKWIRNM